MITKTLIAAAAVITLAAGVAAPAQAKVNVDLYVGGFGPGYGGGYYAPDYGVYDAPRHPRRHQYQDDYSYGISCEEGREEVSHAGFRKVRAISCSGKRYTYKARRNGEGYIVKVSRRSGDIISVQPNY